MLPKKNKYLGFNMTDDLKAQLEEIADKRFDGNKSLVLRNMVYDCLENKELMERKYI